MKERFTKTSLYLIDHLQFKQSRTFRAGAFIRAFKRFVERRGRSFRGCTRRIYSVPNILAFGEKTQLGGRD